MVAGIWELRSGELDCIADSSVGRYVVDHVVVECEVDVVYVVGDTGGGLEYREPAEPCTGAVEPNDLDEPAKPDWNKLADSPSDAEAEACTSDNVKEYVVAQNQLKVAYLENATASKSSLSLISHRGDMSSQDDALSELATRGYRKLPRQYLKQIFPSTDFTEEIKLMARMRAYFDVMQMVRCLFHDS